MPDRLPAGRHSFFVYGCSLRSIFPINTEDGFLAPPPGINRRVVRTAPSRPIIASVMLRIHNSGPALVTRPVRESHSDKAGVAMRTRDKAYDKKSRNDAGSRRSSDPSGQAANEKDSARGTELYAFCCRVP